jgi:hypothetical protein
VKSSGYKLECILIGWHGFWSPQEYEEGLRELTKWEAEHATRLDGMNTVATVSEEVRFWHILRCGRRDTSEPEALPSIQLQMPLGSVLNSEK